MSENVRQPDFAGSWYPATEGECRAMFERFDATIPPGRQGSARLQAGIVPHAGWIFSGAVAHAVVRELAASRPDAETVLLLGGHLGPGSDISILVRGDFWTPLGPIPTDEELAAELAARLGDRARQQQPGRHTPDNTTELQAPLIKHAWPRARMIVVGAPPRRETFALVDAVKQLADARGRAVVAIGSTDLTHYGPNYGWAPRGHGPEAEAWVREENDPRYIERVCELDAEGSIEEALRSSNACCPGAGAAAVHWSRLQGAVRGELLAYGTSADVRRDASFVGYAGIVI